MMAPLISTMTPRCKCRCPYFGKRKLRDRKWIMTQEVGGIGLRDDWIWNSPRRTSTEICYLMDREVTAQSGRNLASMTCRRAVRKPSWGGRQYPNTHSEPQPLVDVPELEGCPHSESVASVTGLC